MASHRGAQARLAVPSSIVLLLLLAAVLLLACPLHPASVVAAAQGHSVRPLHGPGYEHLDCSACLTVARTLFSRLNDTLSTNPSTYLISHRLDKENQLRRRHYRNSELLVTEVMENVCVSYTNDERSLRLHPKSKVRLYHQQIFGDIALGVRHALREDELYPADADPTAWDDRLDGHRFTIGTVYSPKDADALHGMQNLAAAPTMCALLMEELEEEVEELVKTAGTQAEMEYGLCGMALPVKNPGGDGDAGPDSASAVKPVTNICADEEVLRAAAHRDQLRWSQYTRREARRVAERAERKKAAAAAAAAAPASAADTDSAEGGDATTTTTTSPPPPTDPAGAGNTTDADTTDVAVTAAVDDATPGTEATDADKGANTAGDDGDGDL